MAASVVLLHGFSGSPASFDPVVRELGDGIAVFRPTLLGHGAADDLTVDGFDAEVDRLAASIQARGTDHHLLGYSLGGRLALGLLVRRPELFRSAILVSSSPGLERDDERPARRAQDGRLVELLERDGIAAFVDVWEALPLFATQRRLPSERLAAQRAARLAHDPNGLARSLRLTGLAEMPSYWEVLPRLALPVTLIAGALDSKFRAILTAMSERLPRATLQIVPDAGHNVLLERPDVLVAALLGNLGAAA
ncbi:MAG TPA: 2-succinyl-6-hydroxy-2,4-cyclohexadiene-1-carboxylate synthase [Polyangiaceae bacterium]|nr:2-succinyl-6-hydroxy-2,4-cyclohexadiene-1-carboxylate synthase [Polyangiaceae bacterium]